MLKIEATLYKMKKTLILIATFAVCFSSCGNKTNNSTETNAQEPEPVAEVSIAPQLDSASDIEARVLELYESRKDPYSLSFLNVINKVEEADEVLWEKERSLGFIDFDILTQAQDEVAIKSVSVTDITKTTANAIVKTVWFDNEIREDLNLKLVKENGVWKIDDIDDTKTAMIEYLESLK